MTSPSFERARAEGPLGRASKADELDSDLAARGLAGDSDALEQLLRRHQPWVYALSLRMLGSQADAAEVAQEALLKLVTRLSQFRGDAAFRTWAYRLVVRSVLDHAKSVRRRQSNFEGFAAELIAMGNEPPGDGLVSDPDHHVLLEETRMRCMAGMLLCLSPDQRIVYILADLFDVDSTLGAEILEIRPATFRKRLERARTDLGHFVYGQCGLVNPDNPCRCPGKTSVLLSRGVIDPRRLVFTEQGWRRSWSDAPKLARTLGEALTRFRGLLGDQPLLDGPDLASRLRGALETDLAELTGGAV